MQISSMCTGTFAQSAQKSPWLDWNHIFHCLWSFGLLKKPTLTVGRIDGKLIALGIPFNNDTEHRYDTWVSPPPPPPPNLPPPHPPTPTPHPPHTHTQMPPPHHQHHFVLSFGSTRDELCNLCKIMLRWCNTYWNVIHHACRTPQRVSARL